MNRRCTVAFAAVIVLLAISVYINLITGTVRISPSEVFGILRGADASDMGKNVVLAIRLPRTAAALILGGALALSGYLLQTFFDNPIVGPFVLGISSGAKLTVAISLIFFMDRGIKAGSAFLVVSAFIGAMAAMGFVLALSVRVRSMAILVVCGIMTGYICSAVTDLVVTFADDANIANLHNWSMGSLSGMNLSDIAVMSVIVGACVIAVIMLIKPIGAYRLGEAYAGSVGVNITILRILLIVISSLLAACVTAFAGPISFVGIAVPHLVRGMTKTSSPAVMIPGCFLTGALVTSLCDCLARNVFAPTEVSISSVTAVLLVPVVIFVMIKRRKGSE
ncbi:MAG: iron ABC transporter permease [Lachnospiraceae bacterium]|nr:iron ABC transporter permease [Lachnospiraceae bacterium]